MNRVQMFRNDTCESISVLICGRGVENLCVYLCVSTYDQDVVELLHSVYLRKQLVDHGVVDACAACHAATLFADCINLIQYDDVKATVRSKLCSKERREKDLILLFKVIIGAFA